MNECKLIDDVKELILIDEKVIKKSINTKSFKMQYRNERIEAELEELKGLPNIEVILCEPDDIMRLDLWIIWVHGKKGSLYDGGVYPVKITFPDKYPLQAPVIEFEK